MPRCDRTWDDGPMRHTVTATAAPTHTMSSVTTSYCYLKMPASLFAAFLLRNKYSLGIQTNTKQTWTIFYFLEYKDKNDLFVVLK